MNSIKTTESDNPTILKFVFWITLVLFFIVCTAIIWIGGTAPPNISDDAFYYFTVSRNYTKGYCFSFDRMAPTDGFHPLWAVLLLPLYYVFPEAPWIPVRVALNFLVLFQCASAYLIYAMLKTLRRSRAGMIGALLYLTSPFTVNISFKGLETPLSMFLFLAASYLFIRQSGRKSFRFIHFLMLGLMLGLCVLARTENLIFAGVLISFLFLHLNRRNRKLFRAAGFVLFTVIVCVACISPWFIRSKVFFGSFSQVSGLARKEFVLFGDLPEVFPENMKDGTYYFTAGKNILINVQTILRRVYFNITKELLKERRWSDLFCGIQFVIVLISAAVVIINRKISVSKSLLFIYITCILHFLVYAAYFTAYNIWYFLLPTVAFSLLIGDAANLLCRRFRKITAGFLMFALAFQISLTVISLSGISWELRKPDEYVPPLFQNIQKHIPQGTRFGSFNAGLFGYLLYFTAPGSYAINLDCLVNNKAFQAYKTDRYLDYVRQNVDVLVEPPKWLAVFVGQREASRFAARYIENKIFVRPYNEFYFIRHHDRRSDNSSGE